MSAAGADRPWSAKILGFVYRAVLAMEGKLRVLYSQEIIWIILRLFRGCLLDRMP
jgi:hypothetical protein